MTFIIAIQLNDSIVITADHKIASLEDGEVQLSSEDMHKMYAWRNGIITGTGEHYVISRAVEFFKKFVKSDLHKLGYCLDVSKSLRTLEIGKEYNQVKNSKLLCSCYTEQGAQLYTVQRFDDSKKHIMTALKPMQIVIWLFHPNVETVTEELQNLHLNLKDYSYFDSQIDWVNHYLKYISPIYKKQCLQDPLMSESFDCFFQMKEEYLFGHIHNHQDSAIEFKVISS